MHRCAYYVYYAAVNETRRVSESYPCISTEINRSIQLHITDNAADGVNGSTLSLHRIDRVFFFVAYMNMLAICMGSLCVHCCTFVHILQVRKKNITGPSIIKAAKRKHVPRVLRFVGCDRWKPTARCVRPCVCVCVVGHCVCEQNNGDATVHVHLCSSHCHCLVFTYTRTRDCSVR